VNKLYKDFSLAAVLLFALAATAQSAPAKHASTTSEKFSGARALELTGKFVAIGPRWIGSDGHAKAEEFIKQQLTTEAVRGWLETDAFTANTPIGPQNMRNYIVRYPGKKDGVIVLVSHYETNYPLRTINFVGANDGGSSTGLLLEIAGLLRTQTPGGKLLDGYSIWLVFDDGEEAIKTWNVNSDALYGTRHLAAKWQNDGTLGKIKALMVDDMTGDKDLDISRDSNSTPWLEDLIYQAAKNTGHAPYFFASTNAFEDDHLPFVKRGVPSADILDLNYGPPTQEHPEGGYHHTALDTMDKISAHSLQVTGDVIMETIRLLDQK